MDFTQLDRLVNEGYLSKKISPCGKLMLFNYTAKCTYEKKWNKYTRACRGTVYEIKTEKIVAKAFDKFFNFGELSVSKSRNIVKQEKYTVTKKMDGSLGLLYYYDGSWRMNTRGSFESDQAKEGLKILNEKCDISCLNPCLTFLVEIIYPDNRIVVNYGDKKELVILAIFNPSTDKEIIGDAFDLAIAGPCMPVAESFDYTFDELFKLQKTLPSDNEGFVVRLMSGERVKFKCAEYMKIARVLSHATPLEFWKKMDKGVVNRSGFELLPEELKKDIGKMVKTLENNYLSICNEIYQDYEALMKQIQAECFGNVGNIRKEMSFRTDEYRHGGSMFHVYDDCRKCIDKYVMRLIKPKSNVLEDF